MKSPHQQFKLLTSLIDREECNISAFLSLMKPFLTEYSSDSLLSNRERNITTGNDLFYYLTSLEDEFGKNILEDDKLRELIYGLDDFIKTDTTYLPGTMSITAVKFNYIPIPEKGNRVFLQADFEVLTGIPVDDNRILFSRIDSFFVENMDKLKHDILKTVRYSNQDVDTELWRETMLNGLNKFNTELIKLQEGE